MIDPGDLVSRGYEICETRTRRAAGNFWLGIRLLPAARRRGLAAVYWFSRRADDAADGREAAGLRARALDRLREDLDRALAGAPPAPEWAALADATTRYAVPADLYRNLLDGVARDLDPAPFADWESLRRYCFGVASVVGLIGLRVFGGDGRDAEAAAEELGYALQLTNILRDLREDAVRGRWYLPLDESTRFGVTREAVADGRAEPGFDALVLATAERARAFYAASPRLCRRLPLSTRACPAALAGVYRGILERIARAPRAALHKRVRLSAPARTVRGIAAAATVIVP